MRIVHTDIPEVVILEPQVFEDERGFFLETYRKSVYQDLGLPELVQDNHSRSRKGVLRGLHYQKANAQGKLVTVTRGSVFDVAVDVRRKSPSYGGWVGTELNDQNHHQLYIPPGFAHGFLVLSDEVDFIYKCSDYYNKEFERALNWSDPDIAIGWPIEGELILSDKDKAAPFLNDIPEKELPVYVG